ncbi:hypothetical protein GA0070617_5453 [Micromonospora yangpuensis]|uniref:Uncharacterized protein n=2 Tax=Micromonosporaceae TaxID=28056 RepID=A0A1C6VDD1_9ACTN|nr:hypothetical protein GA0070617_5453 [Micromonospora yangpuensis]
MRDSTLVTLSDVPVDAVEHGGVGFDDLDGLDLGSPSPTDLPLFLQQHENEKARKRATERRRYARVRAALKGEEADPAVALRRTPRDDTDPQVVTARAALRRHLARKEAARDGQDPDPGAALRRRPNGATPEPSGVRRRQRRDDDDPKVVARRATMRRHFARKRAALTGDPPDPDIALRIKRRDAGAGPASAPSTATAERPESTTPVALAAALTSPGQNRTGSRPAPARPPQSAATPSGTVGRRMSVGR